MGNPFSWSSLTTVPGPRQMFDISATIYLVVFCLGLIVSTIFYNDWGRPLVPSPLIRRLLRRLSGWAMTIFVLGLFFFSFRVLQINPFSFGMRIWLWLSVLALVGFAGYVAWYLWARYPVERAEWEARRQRNAYIRPAVARGAAGASAATARGPISEGRRVVRRRRR